MNANTKSASHSAPAGSGADSQPVSPLNWEERYQRHDTPWDKGEAAPPLLDFLARHPISGRVLVPGSGAGHDVRAIAGQGARVTGLDISPTAISLARSFPSVADETHETGDLFQLPASWRGNFDWVVEHTCFCAIDLNRRHEYVRAVADLLKPGGHYFAVFYLNPSTDEGPPFGVTRAEIAKLFDTRFVSVEEWVPARSFTERHGSELCHLGIRR